MLKSATPVAVLMAAWLFRQENPNLLKFINVLIISIGVAIASVCTSYSIFNFFFPSELFLSNIALLINRFRFSY